MAKPDAKSQPSIAQLEERLRSLTDEAREVRKALRLARSIERADLARASRREAANAG